MVEILEKGAVSFLAVARGGAATPRGPADLDRLFVVLAPEGRPLRRISVRSHRLPDPRHVRRSFAQVDRIAPAPGGLTEDVRARRGSLAAHILAVGHYALARHQRHIHLAYALARACARGELAAAAGVAYGASFVVSILGRSLPPGRRPRERSRLAEATPERLDVVGAEVAFAAGQHPHGARPGAVGGRDRVGDALVGALLRRGPRPRLASFAAAARAAARRHPRSRA